MADVTKATRPARQAAGRGRQAADQAVGKGRQAAEDGPQKMLPDGLTSELGSALQNVALALAERALSSVTGKVEGVTGRLTDFAQGDGGGGGLLGAITGSDKSPGSVLAGAATGAFKGKGNGKGNGSKKLKLTTIIETVDVGAPRRVVYNQWTQFQEFPSFMKKVEKVNQESDEKLTWKAQIFLSHREWKSTIREQVPDERIIWRSEGAKGYVDGAVTFHELTPDLTRVVVVLEYHPQGLFEHTGNLWRAQGRRARLELKHFRRHVMTNVLLHPEEMEEGGWRGEIHEGEVVKDHETAVNEEREREEGEEEEPTDELEEGEEEEEEEEEEPEEEEEEEP
ncbi:MAG: integral rane protein-like protein, partial [Nonomuraea muscovyensis]|nr:integral rane protein-like protein [Nonomuraea muscovyensis]